MTVISFGNNYMLYIFAYILVPIGVLAGIEMRKTNNIREYFDRDQTSNLKGIAILLIMIHHFASRMNAPGLLIPFYFVGYLGVAIFLFLSGFGLMSSYLNKDNYLKGFIPQKVGRIYIPSITANILISILGIWTGYAFYSLEEIAKTSLFLQSIVTGEAFWYINAAILFYLFFYASLRFLEPKKAIMAMFILTFLYMFFASTNNFGIWWYNTALAFPFGVLFAYKKEQVFKLIEEKYWQTLISSLLLFFITFILASLSIWNKTFFDILSSLFFVGTIAVWNVRGKLNSSALSFMGNISFELYLIHSVVYDIVYDTFPTTKSYSFYIVFVGIVILSLLLKKANDLFFEKTGKKFSDLKTLPSIDKRFNNQ